MQELIKISINSDGQKVVSARVLHEFLGAGSNVSTWFKNQADRAMLEDGVDYVCFQIYESEGRGGQNKIDYAITLNAAKEISMLNGGDKGKQARQYFIECEKQLTEIKKASYQIEDPIERAKAWIEEQEKSKELLQSVNDKIEADKPKVVFAESVMGSSNSILIRQFAKDLCDDNFEIGQNRLFDWFRQNGYLNDSNEPYQEYIAQGLFEVITRAIGSGNDTFTSKTTKLTGKGQVYFAKKIKAS